MIHIDEESAYLMGVSMMQTARCSQSLAANPFAPGTELCKSWYLGWLHMADVLDINNLFDFGARQ